jgi:hypothetical protein
MTLLFLLFIFFQPIPAIAQYETSLQKASVIIDPADKQKTRGYASIALVWGKQIRPPKNYNKVLINLKNAMGNWTDVYTTLHTHLPLESELLLKTPIVIITTEDDFNLTMIERMNVKEYFEKGGFIVCENARGTRITNPVEKSFKRMITETLGKEAQFRPIPKSHNIYHCFFDFEDGPPSVVIGNIINTGYIEGVWYKDRLTAVYSNMGYTRKWNDDTGNIPQLKLGVNMIIFSLIREGSIAR